MPGNDPRGRASRRHPGDRDGAPERLLLGARSSRPFLDHPRAATQWDGCSGAVQGAAVLGRGRGGGSAHHRCRRHGGPADGKGGGRHRLADQAVLERLCPHPDPGLAVSRGCRWERAPLPEDEEQRLATLHSLGILDTPPEQRFDRLTRLAAAVLRCAGGPASASSTADRQWFKSLHGLELVQTSREVSFCAHAVASREMLIVPDALHDARFADNPLVTGGPRIRFYVGFPLFVEGSCIGTLCACDTRPRHVDADAVGLLRDVAALVELELLRTNAPDDPSGPPH